MDTLMVRNLNISVCADGYGIPKREHFIWIMGTKDQTDKKKNLSDACSR